MTVRVQMGKLPSGDYGLRVVSSDGTTVIIDGTSDMFRISANGTITNTVGTGAPGSNWTNVTLTGLGALATTPAHLSFVSTSNASSSDRLVGRLIGWETGCWVAATSGGATTTSRAVVYTTMEVYTYLDGSSNCVVEFGGYNFISSATWYCKYYVLAQVAL